MGTNETNVMEIPASNFMIDGPLNKYNYTVKIFKQHPAAVLLASPIPAACFSTTPAPLRSPSLMLSTYGVVFSSDFICTDVASMPEVRR